MITATAYITEKNEEYQKHLAVFNACKAANIDRIPQETAYFFGIVDACNWEDTIVTEQLIKPMPFHISVTEVGDVCEIYVSQIPKDVEKIVISNTY